MFVLDVLDGLLVSCFVGCLIVCNLGFQSQCGSVAVLPSVEVKVSFMGPAPELRCGL